ncbi:MAG TPA: DEAD/DEAH box helicase [Bacteroidota bacterium]|nr:DEAD/DEAH box helicase [Bacteroidota bacterium]
MSFSKLGLADQLVQGILATGYTAPTAIQERAIPLAVAGRDIIGCAKTGTGKTAAFVLPMLNHFLTHSHHKGHQTRGLIVTPTRELAQQVEESVVGYGRFAPFQSLAIFGGVNMENQIKRLARGIDIVVATPGRLLDHLNRGTIDLSHVEILVLDEADRMFDMGFIKDIRKIIARLPVKRQTLLFSATMSAEVRKLVASIQSNPELIEIGELRKPVEAVKQVFYSIPQEAKIDLLLHILQTQELDSVLIFSRTKHGADKIQRKLERAGVNAVAIHSNRTQAQRQRALAGFKQGHFKVMVATDIAARGIDVDGISHVVNFDTPTFAEDYIHRIGRTGRASSTGDAITFVSNGEQKFLKSIERYVGDKANLHRYPGFDYSAKPATEERAAHGHDGHGQKERTDGRHDDRRNRYPNDRSGRPSREERGSGHPAGRPRGERSGKWGHSQQRDHHRNNSSDQPKDGSVPENRRHERTHATAVPRHPKPSQTLSEERDWRKLVASTEESGKFRKKLKKLFLRKKA